MTEALTTLRGTDDAAGLSGALFVDGEIAGARANLEAVVAASREIRALGPSLGPEALGHAESLEGTVAAAAGRTAEARAHFAEARNLLIASGGDNFAAIVSIAAANAELAGGELERAARSAEEAAQPFRGQTPLGESVSLDASEIVLARIDARSGRLDDAARRLAVLDNTRGKAFSRGEEATAEPRPDGQGGATAQATIDQRLAFLTARAELAALDGRPADARDDLAHAIAIAGPAERITALLSLRLDVAALDPAAQRSSAAAIEREARNRGLLALAARAHGVATRRSGGAHGAPAH
jgi:hypothetical protein